MLDGRDTLFVTPTGAGKCVHVGAIVALSTGELIPGFELLRRWSLGERPRLISYDRHGYQRIAAPVDVIGSGRKKGRKVRFRSGRETWASLDHRFFGGSGKVAVRDLSVGQLVAAPRVFHGVGDGEVDGSELDIVALMLCDGSSAPSRTPQYSKSDTDLIELCAGLVSSIGCTPHYDGRSLIIPALSRPGRSDGLCGASKNPLNVLLDKYGLFGVHSPDREIHESVLRLPADKLCRFLGRVISGDGGIERRNVAYSSASKKLIKQLQHLFLRCGILSYFRYKSALCEGNRFDSWALFISGRDNLEVFKNSIAPWLVGKKKRAFRKMWTKLSKGVGNSNTDVVPYRYWGLLDAERAKQGLSKTHVFDGFFYLRNSRRMSRKMFAKRSARVGLDCELLSKNDVFWDELVELGPVEEKETFDVVMERHDDGFRASFVADDCVLHNSLVYQLPALMLDGVTLVVSPLISLMKDQVDGLVEMGIEAAFYNSTLTDNRRDEVIEGINDGLIKIVFVAPEGLSPRFIQKIKVEVSLLACDESHVVSQWGHDFRPSYLKLGQLRETLGNPPVIATTATATKIVRGDISKQLKLKNTNVLVRGFDRPNLHIAVKNVRRPKDDYLTPFIERVGGPCIIYCGTKKTVESVAENLRNEGVDAKSYHGGMTAQTRTKVQEAFMAGETRVIVATNAFGMGVDKSDIRGVVHYQTPGSIEAYYQEIGRAGRDGKNSFILLLYRRGDRDLHDFFVDSSWPPDNIIEDIWMWTMNTLQRAKNGKVFASQDAIAKGLGWPVVAGQVGAVWRMMEAGGVIKRHRANDVGEVAHIQHSKVFRGNAKKVLDYLLDQVAGKDVWFEVSTIQMASDLHMPKAKVSVALKSLNRVAIEYNPPSRSGGVELLKVADMDDIIDWEYVRYWRGMSKKMVDQMISFITRNECRRALIMRYFGDVSKPKGWTCGTCDVCRGVS